MSTVGQRIKTTRLARKMGQIRLGELIGRDQQTISTFENDRKLPSENAFQSLAKALKVHVGWLRYGPGNDSNELEILAKQIEDFQSLYEEVDNLRCQFLALVNYLQVPRRVLTGALKKEKKSKKDSEEE